jgi:hypothetical protein
MTQISMEQAVETNGKKPVQLGVFPKMLWAYMTWLATSGNGVRTGMAHIAPDRKQTQQVQHPVITVLFAAAPGSMRSGSVGPSIAAGAGLSPGTTSLAFGLSVPRSSFLLSEILFSVEFF